MSRPFDPEAHLDASSATVGLEVADEYRDGVVRFLEIAAEMAAILDTVPLETRDDALAPVFRLIEDED